MKKPPYNVNNTSKEGAPRQQHAQQLLGTHWATIAE